MARLRPATTSVLLAFHILTSFAGVIPRSDSDPHRVVEAGETSSRTEDAVPLVDGTQRLWHYAAGSEGVVASRPSGMTCFGTVHGRCAGVSHHHMAEAVAIFCNIVNGKVLSAKGEITSCSMLYQYQDPVQSGTSEHGQIYVQVGFAPGDDTPADYTIDWTFCYHYGFSYPLDSCDYKHLNGKHGGVLSNGNAFGNDRLFWLLDPNFWVTVDGKRLPTACVDWDQEREWLPDAVHVEDLGVRFASGYDGKR